MSDGSSELESLGERLYSRKGVGDGLRTRARLSPSPEGVPRGWEASQEPSAALHDMAKRRHAPTLLLIAAGIFFILSAVIAGALFFFGGNSVSAQNVSIGIQGPVSIPGGKELALQLVIENGNPTPLQVVDLVIEYPEGTRDAEDITRPLLRSRESLGDIPSGEAVRRTARAVLFGAEDAVETVRVSVEYRVPGSNAVFVKEAAYDVRLSSAPMSVSVLSLDEVSSGQEFELEVSIVSNSTSIIKNALLSVSYPSGFTFRSASVPPAFGTNVWQLGDLPPEGKRSITIRGALEGQDNDERVFRFSGGIGSDTDPRSVGTAFIRVDRLIAVKRPFIGVDVAVNGTVSKEVAVQSGKVARVDIEWRNNLPSEVRDVVITAVLSGSALNKSSVDVSNGFYQSSNNTVTWTQSGVTDLAAANPGEGGRVGFSFSPYNLSGISSLRDPEISITVSVSGKRLDGSNVSGSVDAASSVKAKVASDLILTPRSLYASGPFTNSGPLPPKVDQKTTYTAVWTVVNSTSAMKGVRVSATLPSYVSWVGSVSPSNEDLSFNPVGGVVTWNLGNVPAGTGFGSAPREVSFQVSFTPSVSQVKQAPVLVGQATISGVDQFTLSQVSRVTDALTTRLDTEASAPPEHEFVIE